MLGRGHVGKVTSHGYLPVIHSLLCPALMMGSLSSPLFPIFLQDGSVYTCASDRWVFLSVSPREKWRDLTQSYDKSPYTNRNVKRAKWQHKQRHKKFDYTAVADRLRTVSWSNYSHPTTVVNQFQNICQFAKDIAMPPLVPHLSSSLSSHKTCKLCPLSVSTVESLQVMWVSLPTKRASCVLYLSPLWKVCRWCECLFPHNVQVVSAICLHCGKFAGDVSVSSHITCKLCPLSVSTVESLQVMWVSLPT